MTWNNHLLLIFIFTSIISIYSDELSDLNKKFISTYDHARDYLISITNPLIICNGDDVIIIHRARYGYIEKTYFYTLLGERHEGNHIIYAENIDNEQRALEILGVWVLDARASASFFSGDSERLHRDVLADAGVAHIKRIFKTSKSEL
ncbi:unnamed protein product [Adineta steineri]|uniref:Uncharacterized protein n=1 Tax=Adineta steineri TaxID=433720 RepID=A0A814ZY68_9BILA|nr:unnamed protein product [Adineta steineri]